jgi:hypothetical protein
VFENCSEFSSIWIPSSADRTGTYCFHQCQSLSTVTFESGSKLSCIDDHGFDNCSLLSSISIPSSGLMNCSGSRIIRYFGRDSEIEIPDTVELIDHHCFSHCGWVCEIGCLPLSSLRPIREQACTKCEVLQSISISVLVMSIPYGCFLLCKSLQSVSFSSDSRLTEIEVESFADVHWNRLLFRPKWRNCHSDGSAAGINSQLSCFQQIQS